MEIIQQSAAENSQFKVCKMNDYYQNNYLVKVIFMLLDLCAFVLSVSGNSMVIYVMSRERKLRKKSNYYIISVAMADLLIGVIGIPAILYTVNFS